MNAILPFPTQGATALAPMFVCPGCDRVITPSNERIQRADGVYMHSECAGLPFILPTGEMVEALYPRLSPELEQFYAGHLISMVANREEGTVSFTFTDAHKRPAMVTGNDHAHAVAIAYRFVADQRRAIARAGRAS